MAPKKKKKKPPVRKVSKKAKPAAKKTPLKTKTPPVPAKPAPKKRIRVNPMYLPMLKRLQDRRNEITGQVSHLEQDLKDDLAESQNIPGDLADHGSDELNQHLSVTLMENDRVELERIERAISRIELGLYGQCEVCKKTINLTRLKAIPWAIRCIHCQSRFEGV
jgi:DnaK suppressor protein